VTRKIGVRDPRQDPTDDDGNDAQQFRVDRVFARPAARARRESAQVAAELLAAARPTHSSVAPPIATNSGEVVDTELSLRRHLSRLQRQLAEAQRELANKDDELAAEVENRVAISSEFHELADRYAELEARTQQMTAYRTRTDGVEIRLAEALARIEELVHDLEVERATRAAAEARVADLAAAMDDARVRRIDERAQIDDEHSEALAELEQQKTAALAAAAAELEAATARQREAHEAELAELRAAHERSLGALRGELEPKVLEARSLAEECARLASEATRLETEASRAATERTEAHRRELALAAEAHASELAAHTRSHGAELTRALGERDAEILAHQQTIRSGELREALSDQSIVTLREAQKKLQVELAEARERCTVLETDRWSAEDRLNAATAANAALVEERRALQERLDQAEAEARRNALDRLRFVRYLEEGLALVGALPAIDSGSQEIPFVDAEPDPDVT
jgi:chromosome segregation ATPase